MTEPLDPELIRDGLSLLDRGRADYIIFGERETRKVTDTVEDSGDAAYYALIRAGFTSMEIVLKHSRTAHRLSRAITRRAVNIDLTD